ncbi:hypothetical protein MIR68_008037 [Amoeboaphelidium protococcarum]|nr:hypothetical protein MIR68_008037 [Amoeboaphelidium protococcarum]
MKQSDYVQDSQDSIEVEADIADTAVLSENDVLTESVVASIRLQNAQTSVSVTATEQQMPTIVKENSPYMKKQKTQTDKSGSDKTKSKVMHTAVMMSDEIVTSNAAFLNHMPCCKICSQPLIASVTAYDAFVSPCYCESNDRFVHRRCLYAAAANDGIPSGNGYADQSQKQQQNQPKVPYHCDYCNYSYTLRRVQFGKATRHISVDILLTLCASMFLLYILSRLEVFNLIIPLKGNNLSQDQIGYFNGFVISTIIGLFILLTGSVCHLFAIVDICKYQPVDLPVWYTQFFDFYTLQCVIHASWYRLEALLVLVLFLSVYAATSMLMCYYLIWVVIYISLGRLQVLIENIKPDSSQAKGKRKTDNAII